MTSRVGSKGQLVIPKHLRDRLGLRSGDEVSFELDDESVRIRPLRAPEDLRGRLAGLSLTAALEEDRRAELAR